MKDYQVRFALAALAVVTPMSALAQTTASQTSAAAPVATAPVDEVIVTGSRISRKDYSASTPVVTVGQGAIEKAGSATLDTVLKEQPQFTASTGSTTNSSGNGGQANLQLRGLGRQRTLVLMDGRRLPPSNSDGSVDINTIPSALIENVEIITGGASAVYGSDAVAGVVNIRMKHHFDGLEVDGQAGASAYGDANAYKLSVIGGGEFAQGRGSNVFSIEYAERDLITLADRDFTIGASRDSVLSNGLVSFAPNSPTQAAIDSVFAKYGVAAGTVKATNSFGFNTDGTLFSTGQTAQNFRDASNPLYHVTSAVVQEEGRQFRYLQLPLKTYALFDRASYDITSDLHAFTQIYYTNSVASTRLNPVSAPSSATTGVPLVPVTNPFIPADLKILLASRPNPTAAFALSERFDVTGPRIQQNTSDVFQIVGGLDGKLPFKDWTWSADATYGRNDLNILQPNWTSRSGLATLFNAADGGASLCSGGYNPFGNAPVSAACKAIFTKRLHSSEVLEQKVFEANTQGSLLSLPAGEVRFAAGADYREDNFTNEPDAAIASGDIIALGGAYFTGRTATKELYGELLVPLLKDLPLIHALDADLGFRVSDYNTVGTVTTYRADGSWKTVFDLTLRGGYERAIRAPNIGELDTPVSLGATVIGLAGAIGSGDPCDINGAYRKGANAAQVRTLCIANGVPTSLVDTYTFAQQSAGIKSGGNSNLTEETADTYSIGAVWRPHFNSDLSRNISVSVDYYNINVQNAIGTITAPLALSRCFNGTGTTNPTYDPNNVFCKLVTRNGDGSLNLISTQSLNLGGYKTSGIDVQVDWRFPTRALGLSDGGQISVNLLTTYLDSFKIQSLPGDPFLNYAGTIGNGQVDPVAISRPHWKSNLYFSYDRGPLTAGVTWRYIGAMDNAANVGVTNGTAVGVPSVSYFDLTLRYRLTPKLELWGTVNNVGDKQPPVYPAIGSTDAATYDVIGRAFTVGLKARF